jgi:hypothetical protein
MPKRGRRGQPPFDATMAQRRKNAYKPGAPAEAGHDVAALSRHSGALAGFARGDGVRADADR